MNLSRVLRLNMSGEDVRHMQVRLKELGIHIGRIDGNFGQDTLVSVGNFQRLNSIKVDGIVGPQTWSRIFMKSETKSVIEKDIPFPISHHNENGLKVYDCKLNSDEYVMEETNKNTICLHHTLGGSRPDYVIGGWESDFSKDKNGDPIYDKPYRVATHYVVGRSSSSSGVKLWDGKVLRAFDDKYWAYHLGTNIKNLEMRSISIEICNYGPLSIGRDGRFYNWVNKPINDIDVVKLDSPYKGNLYWERYTEAQLDSTYKLIQYLSKKWNIDIDKGIYNLDWFQYDEKWKSLGGLRSHGQIRTDKSDISPQSEMIKMLNSL